MNRWIVLGIVLGIVALPSACSRRAELRLDFEGGAPRVELWKGGGVFGYGQTAEPIEECVVYLAPPTGNGVPREMWRVKAVEGSRFATEIRYGEVPVGFRQLVPHGGPPPGLVPNRRYLFSCSGQEGGAVEFRVGERITTRPAPPLRVATPRG